MHGFAEQRNSFLGKWCDCRSTLSLIFYAEISIKERFRTYNFSSWYFYIFISLGKLLLFLLISSVFGEWKLPFNFRKCFSKFVSLCFSVILLLFFFITFQFFLFFICFLVHFKFEIFFSKFFLLVILNFKRVCNRCYVKVSDTLYLRQYCHILITFSLL